MRIVLFTTLYAAINSDLLVAIPDLSLLRRNEFTGAVTTHGPPVVNYF